MPGDEQQVNQAHQPDVREEQEAASVRLQGRVPQIMAAWERHARAEVQAARDLDLETLHNNLPQVLEQIAGVLVTSIGRDAYFYAEIPASREHAEQRAALEGYSLDQVILEYHLLRKVLVEVLEQEAPLPRGIGSVVHDGIDRAMQEAVVHFVTTHAEVCREHEARQHLLTQETETLREADRAKDDYLAVLAHELRTPLGTIRNALHLLGELNLGEERAVRHIGVASRQTAHLSRMVEDLLDVSRIVQGKLELRTEPADLCKAAAHAAQTAGPLIEAHAHTLEVSFSADPVQVEADPVRLEQVLTNLLTNCRPVHRTRRAYLADRDLRGGGSPGVRAGHRHRHSRPRAPAGLRPLHATRTDRFPLPGRLGHRTGAFSPPPRTPRGTLSAHSDGPGRGSEFTIYLPLRGVRSPSQA